MPSSPVLIAVCMHTMTLSSWLGLDLIKLFSASTSGPETFSALVATCCCYVVTNAVAGGVVPAAGPCGS